MEFIQWFTQSLDEVTHEPVGDISRHAIFRFDELDKELMSKEILEFFEAENKKYWDEIDAINWPDGLKDEDMPARKHMSYRISEEDMFEYQRKCVGVFIKMLGVNVIDLIG